MKRLLTILVPSLVLVACASRTVPASTASTHVDASPSSEPVTEPPVTEPPATDPKTSVAPEKPEDKSPVAPNVAMIKAGAWPLSNAHTWGTRTFEVRDVDGAWQVRVHDAVSFQGVGMMPEQMAPPREGCTAWEALPGDVATRAKLTSLTLGQDTLVEANETEGVLRAWYEATKRPVKSPTAGEPHAFSHAQASVTFGRVAIAC